MDDELLKLELRIARDIKRELREETIKDNEVKTGPGGFYVDPAMLLEVLRLAQQAGAPGEPTHTPSSDDVVERANAYWAWIKEQQA